MAVLPPVKPLILEIKGNSLDDGPGIRTVVFFKGCPLDCSWCHNPEGKKTVAEISFDEAECVVCGACSEACAKHAIDSTSPGILERSLCDVCGACVEVCPSEALAVVGRRMDVEEVALEVEKDAAFFKTSGGGVTLSGGEPTLFMDYCSRLLERLERSNIHAVVETCGRFDLESFETYILPNVDSIYYDLKIFDEATHRKECGASNEVILENFRVLVGRCRDAGKELLPRVPLVPGITATEENLSQLAVFLTESGVERVALLQYNPLWLDKGRKLGVTSTQFERPEMKEWMSRADVESCRAAFKGFDIL